MFLNKYISEFYYNQILDDYDEEYLKNLNENHFLEIYEIFKKYKFNFIEDIILNYLEIFELDSEEVITGIIKLKRKLGADFVKKIGQNMTYLNEILI